MIEVDLGTLVTIISILVGGTGVGGLLKIMYDRKSGKESGRVAEVERISAVADTERRRANNAEAGRRILAESLSLHRRIIIEAPCLTPADLPPWPEIPKEP